MAEAEGFEIWQRARPARDFATFRPALERIVSLQAAGGRRRSGMTESGTTRCSTRSSPTCASRGSSRCCTRLRDELVPLVADIARHADVVDDRMLDRGFDPAVQLSVCARPRHQRLGFDLERGRQDSSTHPFSTSFGPGDVRITTRVSRDFFASASSGRSTRSGHGDVRAGHRSTTSTGPRSGAGRRRACTSRSPGSGRTWSGAAFRSGSTSFRAFETHSPSSCDGVGRRAFCNAVNKSYPSLIRVEADEVTYNLHVLTAVRARDRDARGEARGRRPARRLERRIQAYLGIEVPNDGTASLQDIHWSDVALRRTSPTYTLGNLDSARS